MPLTDSDRPQAKRQVVEAIESLTSSEDSDDNGQPSLKQAANDSQTVFDQENRMDIYTKFHAFTTLKECYQALNLIPREDLHILAWAICDLPEFGRLKALRMLRETAKSDHPEIDYPEIIKHISKMQINKSHYDPSSLFPSVFTFEYGDTLTEFDGTRFKGECCHCNEMFEEGATMVWKSCLKHALHTHCLRELLDDASHEPLAGPCPCISKY